MNTLPFILARKIIASTSSERSIALMVKICFTALMLSTFGLALIVAIANGFQHETSKKLQNVHADVTISTLTESLDTQKLSTVLAQEFPTKISATCPHAYQPALLYREDTKTMSPLSVCIGTPADGEERLGTITPYLVNKQAPLTAQLRDNKALLGKSLAASLGVTIGDQVTLLYVPHEITQKKVTFDETSIEVGGIFSTGIDELDAASLYLSLDLFEELFPEKAVTELSLRATPGTNLEELAQTLRKRFSGLEVSTWKDRYPALVAALILEKYAAFITLSLVVMIAAINMLALIFMYIIQKKQDIVVLKTLGMPEKHIQYIFMILGFLISLPATILGLAGAAAVSWLLNTYPIISLPDVYYVDHVPAHFDLSLAVTVFCTVMLLSAIAAYIPTRRIRQFSVAHILKFGVE